MEKNLDGNYTRMLQAILNKSWRQHPTKQQLYGNLPSITKTHKIRRTRYVRHCWRSRDELIIDALLWTPSHGRAKAGRQARNYIQELCADTGCSLEELPESMDNRSCGERGSEISVLIAQHDDDIHAVKIWDNLNEICLSYKITKWYRFFKHLEKTFSLYRNSEIYC